MTLAAPLTLNHWDVHLSPSHVLASWGPGIVYSRLLRFQAGPDVEAPTQATECDLCESWEQVDPTTYLFRLREGVLWHDVEPVNGREVVAQDVLYSLRRQLTPSYPNAGILEAIHSMEAEDRYTLRVTLRSADADFLASLASGFTKVVAPEAVELNGDLREGPVIGSGPWQWLGTRDETGYYFGANPPTTRAVCPRLTGSISSPSWTSSPAWPPSGRESWTFWRPRRPSSTASGRATPTPDSSSIQRRERGWSLHSIQARRPWMISPCAGRFSPRWTRGRRGTPSGTAWAS